jgi:hypothetical protein
MLLMSTSLNGRLSHINEEIFIGKMKPSQAKIPMRAPSLVPLTAVVLMAKPNTQKVMKVMIS